MKIDVVAEGDYDNSFVPLIKNILAFGGCRKKLNIKVHPCNGPIVNKAAGLIEMILKNDPQIIVLATDTDNKKKKPQQLGAKIRPYVQAYPNIPIVTCFPDPHFEQWIIKEKTAVQNHFDLNTLDDLPFPDLYPKERIQRIFLKNNEDELMDMLEFYELMSGNLDVGFLRRADRSFRAFVDKMIQASHRA